MPAWWLNREIQKERDNIALITAIKANDTQAALQALERGADPNIRDLYGMTPLLYACGSQYTDSVQLLLEHGADIGARSDYGDTPLKTAQAGRNTALIHLLKQHGAK